MELALDRNAFQQKEFNPCNRCAYSGTRPWGSSDGQEEMQRVLDSKKIDERYELSRNQWNPNQPIRMKEPEIWPEFLISNERVREKCWVSGCFNAPM